VSKKFDQIVAQAWGCRPRAATSAKNVGRTQRRRRGRDDDGVEGVGEMVTGARRAHVEAVSRENRRAVENADFL